jgi:hypothetical protein
LLGRAQASVGLLGQARDRAFDPAALLVGRVAERSPVTSLPELDQGRREQRQTARLPGDASYERRDQLRLDPEARRAGRQLDRPAQLVAAHRPDQDLVGADQGRELGVLGAAPVEVGADRQHDHQALVGIAGTLDQRIEERVALGLVATGDEGLL